MNDQDIFDLRMTVAHALNAEQNAAKRAELQRQLDFLQSEQERLLNAENDALVDILEGPIQRVEEIVRDLGNQGIRDALNRLQDRLSFKRLEQAVVAPGMVPTPVEVAPEVAIPGTTGVTTGGGVTTASISGGVPADWMPNAPMKKIICHWTGGAYKAGGLDKFSYHILIEGDGRLVRGTFSIADNVSNLIWKPRSYAAHTKGANTGSIGISACCMAGAKGSPYKEGSAPMLELQWMRMMEIAAVLCRRYNIPVTRETVLGHGEVQNILGIKQSGKWDPMVLPWDLSTTKSEVGERFRAGVVAKLAP
jgi:hypothetical protein